MFLLIGRHQFCPSKLYIVTVKPCEATVEMLSSRYRPQCVFVKGKQNVAMVTLESIDLFSSDLGHLHIKTFKYNCRSQFPSSCDEVGACALLLRTAPNVG